MESTNLVIFERPPVSRIFSCAAVFASAAIVFTYLAEHPDDYRLLPLAGLVLLFLGTLLAALIQYGDHIYLSDYGVKYENRFLTWLGRNGEWVSWGEIVEIREVKRKILIVLSSNGRRVLVDAILGYAIARAEIIRRAPQAILSGTLARDDS